MNNHLSVLNDMHGLNEVIKLYIPTQDGNGQPVDSSHILRGHALRMEALFGGATVTQGAGYWSNSVGETIIEDVNIITSNSDQLTNESVSKVIEYAQDVKHRLEQQAVTIEVNGTMYFI